MPFISGKQAFLQILRQEGVSVMFGNPGTTELPLMDGLAREPGIRYVLALQEAPAIAMTDGYAQASGGLGAVNVHVSPGLGNAMGMLYDASKSGAPMLLTAGQHDQGFNVTEPILWSDLPPVARPYVKWSTEAHRLDDLPRIVRRAVKTALAHPTGPVFLSLPVDVLNAERDIDLGASTRVAPRLVGDRAAIDEAARRLVRAERPLLVAGDAVAQSDALAELIELAELLGASVVSEGVASTCNFPFSHPLCGGTFPRLAPPIRAFLMRYDLLCSIGADLFTLSLPSDVESSVGTVFETVRLVRRELAPSVALVGFAGAPFTVASYVVEGGASRDYLHTKRLMYEAPAAWHRLMEVLADATATYLNGQIDAGAQMVQLFDSWVGALAPDDYRTYVLPHTRAVIRALRPGTPVVHFGTGTATLLPLMREAGGDVIGLDWRVDLDRGWAAVGHDVGVQGNLDPAVLLAAPAVIRERVKAILARAGARPGHIFNLGHGVHQSTPVDHVRALVDTVHELSAR